MPKRLRGLSDAAAIGEAARKAGRAGLPDTDSIVKNALASTPGVEYKQGSYSVNTATGVTHPVGDYGDTARSAYTQVEGQLAQARQQALGQVPREYHDRVNAAFDTANTQIAEHRKKMGY